MSCGNVLATVCYYINQFDWLVITWEEEYGGKTSRVTRCIDQWGEQEQAGTSTEGEAGTNTSWSGG